MELLRDQIPLQLDGCRPIRARLGLPRLNMDHGADHLGQVSGIRRLPEGRGHVRANQLLFVSDACREATQGYQNERAGEEAAEAETEVV